MKEIGLGVAGLSISGLIVVNYLNLEIGVKAGLSSTI